MAETRLYVSRDDFNCSICLDLLTDPVTIPCGHNYCMNCISRYWNENVHVRIYSCPQCRQNFNPRPVLGKNRMVAEMVEKLRRRTRHQTAHVLPTDVDAGPGDVECDVCTDRKYKAIKTCLVCLNSICQSHLQQHENLFEGDRHCLIDATELQDMICPIHNELLDIFCHTDQMSICLRCTRDIHRNHNVSSGAERMNQSSPSVSIPPEPVDHSSFNFASRSSTVRKTFSKRLKRKVDSFLNAEVLVVSGWIMCCNFPSDGPKNRNEILQYTLRLSMDLNTVNEIVQLSEGNRVATNNGTVQRCPDHPERFDCWPQVLCKESVSGRAYWEFEWSGSAGVEISLSYKTIIRKGRGQECKFGCNDQSMSLFCSPTKYTYRDNNKKTKLSVNTSKIKSSRIGVYLDYSAGIVSFFSISDRMKLIYIAPAKFTQPLYPGFRIYFGSAVRLCEPEVNCR